MGTLYLIATPLGNLEDITLRALRVLREVDLIACEDTRHTAKLLARYGISTPRESCHKFNEAHRARRFIQLLSEGKNIALTSDSGTPLVSDPGYELVTACLAEGIRVIPVPGPSAAVAALTGSGLPADNFYFAGFLPPRKTARRRKLKELAGIPATLVFYEAPHRILGALTDMISILGDRRACLAREMTKLHEEFMRGPLADLLALLEARPRIQGEITLIVERGRPEAVQTTVFPDSIRRHLDEEIERTGLSRNEALKSIARQRGISRKQAYDQLNEKWRPTDEN
ncbi:MAG TPA: 16S rRNA (cytidine(1402)-2'-O)-methyltransferase [Acidobacteriota bacterium]|nr:16S rRNA (cytidine(1402)-2'-O)-methyltransferase [Acidobacteriota bacterium]